MSYGWLNQALTLMRFVICFDLIKIFDLLRYRNGWIIIRIIFLMPKLLHSQGTWKLAKCSVYVRNGYDGQSEIVSELARHTALKRWIATKILWYRNAASRRSTVQRVDLLPISVRKCWASSARGPSVSKATGQKIWLDERLLYLAALYYYYYQRLWSSPRWQRHTRGRRSPPGLCNLRGSLLPLRCHGRSSRPACFVLQETFRQSTAPCLGRLASYTQQSHSISVNHSPNPTDQ